jgi:hypothetical protein
MIAIAINLTWIPLIGWFFFVFLIGLFGKVDTTSMDAYLLAQKICFFTSLLVFIILSGWETGSRK